MASRVESRAGFDEYDLVMATCGYESRSRVLASCEIAAAEKIAVGYGSKEEAAFASNSDAFRAAGFNVQPVDDAQFTGWFQGVLSRAETRRILIDISCLTRARLATVVACLMNQPPEFVDFYYSLATFSQPGQDDPQHEFLGPVSEFFSGWAGEYGKPIAVISGLGYEYAKALGLIDFLDPTDTWLFFPTSPIPDYDRAVQEANDILLRDIDPSRILRYDVLDPASLVRDLSALVAAIRTTHRCVILPLGPKVFAFSALLVGGAFRDVSIWRVSAGKFSEPKDRISSELHTIFRVRFDNQAPDGLPQ